MLGNALGHFPGVTGRQPSLVEIVEVMLGESLITQQGEIFGVMRGEVKNSNGVMNNNRMTMTAPAIKPFNSWVGISAILST